jgi:hypothetical protein
MCCLASAGVSAAQTFDINLSNDAARLTYLSPLGQQGFGHGQLEGSVLFTDNDNFLGDVGFGVVGDAGSGSPGLQVGVGVRLYGVTTKHDDIAALALGAQFDYAPPPMPRLHISGSADAAPSIVTFMDGDHMYSADINVGYEIFRDTVAYFGFRKIKVNLDNGGSVTVDSGGYLGVNFRF